MQNKLLFVKTTMTLTNVCDTTSLDKVKESAFSGIKTSNFPSDLLFDMVLKNLGLLI